MDEGACVTAQKEIYLLLSSNEVDKLLTLDREIDRLKTKIEE